MLRAYLDMIDAQYMLSIIMNYHHLHMPSSTTLYKTAVRIK